MTHDRYYHLLNHCLSHPDKSHRDKVLSAQSPNTQRALKHMMAGIAKRLTAFIVHAGADDDQLTKAERREMRRERLEAIPEAWLRARVEAMVVEHFERRKAA